jgi:hypothetical protein
MKHDFGLEWEKMAKKAKVGDGFADLNPICRIYLGRFRALIAQF